MFSDIPNKGEIGECWIASIILKPKHHHYMKGEREMNGHYIFSSKNSPDYIQVKKAIPDLNVSVN